MFSAAATPVANDPAPVTPRYSGAATPEGLDGPAAQQDGQSRRAVGVLDDGEPPSGVVAATSSDGAEAARAFTAGATGLSGATQGRCFAARVANSTGVDPQVLLEPVGGAATAQSPARQQTDRGRD